MPAKPKTAKVKKLTTDKAASTIKRELASLRALIESTDDDIAKRVAWAVEQGIRWAVEKTVGWERPSVDVNDTAKIIREELANHQLARAEGRGK